MEIFLLVLWKIRLNFITSYRNVSWIQRTPAQLVEVINGFTISLEKNPAPNVDYGRRSHQKLVIPLKKETMDWVESLERREVDSKRLHQISNFLVLIKS